MTFRAGFTQLSPGWAVSNITCHAQDRDVRRIVHGLEAAGRFREQLVNLFELIGICALP